MAESAALEMPYAGNGIEGSNPSLTASAHSSMDRTLGSGPKGWRFESHQGRCVTGYLRFGGFGCRIWARFAMEDQVAEVKSKIYIF